MFNALNRFISRLDSDSQNPENVINNAHGFQVLRNTNNELFIEPWFDFIIGINGRNIDNPDGSLFATEVQNCAGKSVSLGLWSAKGQRIRDIYVNVPTDSATLGLSLQWQPIRASEDVWHILEVTTNSPADAAGLLPYSDYIIGSPEGTVRGEAGLGELVEDFLERPMRLYVYNHEYDVTRSITITPSRNWGGSGALGCILGFGALHRIPPPLEEPPQGPGETLFETAPMDGSQKGDGSELIAPPPRGSQYIIPADMQFTSPGASPNPERKTAPGSGTIGRKTKHAHRNAGATDIDAYLAEGEAKSRELEPTPSAKPNASLAPPPKAGTGPPRIPSPLKPEVETVSEIGSTPPEQNENEVD